MSTLSSPGVLVSVQDDSFYAESTAGTVPLVIFATAQDKLIPGSTTEIAEGTLQANAGVVYTVTSQKDVLQTFGTPIFQTNDGSIVQGDELNEYGLHALFSVTGITNRALALRADIDLNDLSPTEVEPRREPLNQTVWLDTASSTYGIFVHNGGTSQNQYSNWTSVTPIVPSVANIDATTGKPLDTLGSTGDYAIVPYFCNAGKVNSEIDVSTVTSGAVNAIYKKTIASANKWIKVTDATYQSMNPPVGKTKGDVWVKYDSSANGMNIVVKKYDIVNHKWTLATVQPEYNFIEIEAKLGSSLVPGVVGFRGLDQYYYLRNSTSACTLTISDIAPMVAKKAAISYTSTTTVGVQKEYITIVDATSFANKINTNTSLHASVSGNSVTIRSLSGRAFSVIDTAATPAFSLYSSVNWTLMNYYALDYAPSREAAEGTYWYDSSLYADVMINDGGRWRGLQSTAGKAVLGSTACSIQFRQSEPTVKSDGTTLEYGDIWIDPADGTNYVFYQYRDYAWFKLDTTDQSTTNGLLFADARSSDENGVSYFSHDESTAYDALIVSDYVDPTCPDPRLYPTGMLMLNLQQTGGVVRERVLDAFTDIAFRDIDNDVNHLANEYFVGDPNSYATTEGGTKNALKLATISGNSTARWNTASGKFENGAGRFGREAQRKIVVKAMAAAIVNSEELRSETIEFNLMCAPGYVELLDELVTLNTDRRETAYIITDVPARLAPDSNSITKWANNSYNAVSNGSTGRVTRYAFAAQYMGWCLGTNTDGNEVAIPGSTVALRTYVYSDSVSYVWFPPAGTERGVVTNASSVGYINSENEFTPVIYNRGQRDSMYLNAINPIAMRPQRGLLVYGDKSLSSGSTALDRVNVGRLIVYIRTEIEKIGERFLFKLNTARVREEFAAALTSFLSNIVQLEGIEDFVVVCDTTNNTAARRNRNELWADIAIVPTKSINFVYVPIRLESSTS